VFVPLVLCISVLATAGVLATGGSPTAALLVGLTVIIVSCPCALGLATPLAVAQGTQTAAKHGLVVASSSVFETPDVDVIALDKTGTLTSGEMEVTETVGDEAILSTAAALERASAHPIADAIVAAAAPSTVDAAAATDGEMATDGGTLTADADSLAVDGDIGSVETLEKGVRGHVDGRDVLVGHPSLFESWTDPDDHRSTAESITDRGEVAVVVGWNETIQGVIAVGDEPNADWEAVVDALADGRREIVVLTGDDTEATRTFRAHPAVDHVFAEVPPQAKAETIRRLQADRRVAMIGDGSNDAPALAAADMGIALATGTKLATDAGDVIVVEGDLAAIPTLFTIAENTKRRVRQNLGWAFFYNAVAIPLAVFGLLNPLFAALAMGASSLLVVANSTLRSLL